MKKWCVNLFVMLTTCCMLMLPVLAQQDDTQKVVDVELPSEIKVTLDPYNMQGHGQIYSEPIEVINRSNIPVIVVIKDINCSYSGSDKFKLQGSPVDTLAESPDKNIHLYMNATNASDENMVVGASFHPRRYVLLPETETVIGASTEDDAFTVGMSAKELMTFGISYIANDEDEDNEDGRSSEDPERLAQYSETEELPTKEPPEAEEDEPVEGKLINDGFVSASERELQEKLQNGEAILLQNGQYALQAEENLIDVGSSKLQLMMGGSVNPNPETPWQSTDLTITVTFSVEPVSVVDTIGVSEEEPTQEPDAEDDLNQNPEENPDENLDEEEADIPEDTIDFDTDVAGTDTEIISKDRIDEPTETTESDELPLVVGESERSFEG